MLRSLLHPDIFVNFYVMPQALTRLTWKMMIICGTSSINMIEILHLMKLKCKKPKHMWPSPITRQWTTHLGV